MKALLIGFLACALFPHTAISQIFRQQVPGTPYTAGLPPSFALSADRERLEDTEWQASFFMVVAPVPFEKMKAFFDAGYLKKHGIDLVTKENTPFRDRTALFLKTLQLQETGEVASLMLLFDNGKETVITTASYPAQHPELEAVMKAALFSVQKNQ